LSRCNRSFSHRSRKYVARNAIIRDGRCCSGRRRRRRRRRREKSDLLFDSGHRNWILHRDDGVFFGSDSDRITSRDAFELPGFLVDAYFIVLVFKILLRQEVERDARTCDNGYEFYR
jgi:hypothetical protein